MVSEEKLRQYKEDALRDEYDEEQQAHCIHENAYVQEFRATVFKIVKNYETDERTSKKFDLEAEHYCPDCGKTKWVNFDLEEEMYYRLADRWISVTGESKEILEG
jgi:hypothetical protein